VWERLEAGRDQPRRCDRFDHTANECELNRNRERTDADVALRASVPDR
jgi:hypothetical protein